MMEQSLIGGIVIYWVGAIADWYTTKRLIFDTTRGKEANPVIRWMIRAGAGEWHLLALKAVIFVVLLKWAAPVGLIVLGFAQCAAALWNKWITRHAR